MAGELILIVKDNARSPEARARRAAVQGLPDGRDGDGRGGPAVSLAPSYPALILMDIQLPGIDGITALHRLRAEAASRDIPVSRCDRVVEDVLLDDESNHCSCPRAAKAKSRHS